MPYHPSEDRSGNCATTMDLNPVALQYQRAYQRIPNNRSQRDIKMYGDVDVTVSDESDKVDPATLGSAFVMHSVPDT